MAFNIWAIALICISYLLVLFGIAYITEKGWVPNSVVRHPITYILSLGVFASAWSFYGVIDLASEYGYGALAYYLGTGAVFLFAPVALSPLAEIARRHQIHSLADLLVFRYHSLTVGTIATLGMLLAVLPLLGLQLQAIANSFNLLTANPASTLSLENTGFTFREVLALAYCLVLAIFTILFGSKREKHRGLVTALAFESLIKVFAILSIGIFSLWGVFGGFDGLDNWLLENPENLQSLQTPVRESSSHTLLLVFIATAVAMPHVFHMSIVESPGKNAMDKVSWAFPLFLLFLALPIFPILWAGIELKSLVPKEYFTIGVPLQANSMSLTILAFIGGLSAATGAQVAITLSITTMVLNHWLLPVLRLDSRQGIYSTVLWLRRFLILAIFIVGYLFFLLLGDKYSLTNLALLAFIQALQFLPGIIAIAYWPRGNSLGFIAGLAVGTGIWFFGLLAPMLSGTKLILIPGIETQIPLGFEYWNQITLWALGLNVLTFILFSLARKSSPEEQYSAELCTADETIHHVRSILDVHKVSEFKQRLGDVIGSDTATQEVDRALKQLNLRNNERRPYALRRLRDRLEANLSGLLGISVATEIIEQSLPYKSPSSSRTADINLIETQFSNERAFSGVAAELNNLRLYYRKTLQELPMAICSLGPDHEILMWNDAMAELTGIKSDDVSGSHLKNLPEPWQTLITEFTKNKNAHAREESATINDESRWFSLHKAIIEGPVLNSADGQVIMVDEVTEIKELENELLHSERLASVGRLAAGVAHEIGNPVTGIACLAQNILYETKNPELLEAAQQIVFQTERIDRIVQSLVSFSHSGRQQRGEMETVQVHACADEAIHLLSLQKDKTSVRFVNQLSQQTTMQGDSQLMIQVFINLLSNARDASPEDSPVTIAATSNEESLFVTVTDEGDGIDPSQIDKVLEPFFTTKEPGEGTGLGLSMVYSIVTDHNGLVDITSPVDTHRGTGTRFTLRFPRTPS